MPADQCIALTRAETICTPPLGDNCRLTHLDERSSRERNSFCCSRLSEFRGQPHGRHLGHAAPWRGNLHRELPGRSPHEMGIHPRGAANSQSSKAAPRAPIARIILSTRRDMTRCAQRGSFPRGDLPTNPTHRFELLAGTLRSNSSQWRLEIAGSMSTQSFCESPLLESTQYERRGGCGADENELVIRRHGRVPRAA